MWRTKRKTQHHESKIDLHCSIHVRVTKQAVTMVTTSLVTLQSMIHSGLLPSLVLRTMLMISVGSRVSSSACWAMYCSTHCTWGQSETHTQRRKKTVGIKNRQYYCTVTVLLTPVLINDFIFISVWVGGVGESCHPPVHVWPVDRNCCNLHFKSLITVVVSCISLDV